MGCTFLISSPCETPCEMFMRCNSGLGAALELAILGGSSLEPPAPMPITLGAETSATGALACTAGAVPDFTTSGAGALAAALGDGVDIDGLVVDGAAEGLASGAVSVSVVAEVLAAGGVAGCEAGTAGAVTGATAFGATGCGLGGCGCALAAGFDDWNGRLPPCC